MTEVNSTNQNDKRILVIGGGMAGMTAAIEAAEAGCRVTLIDKAPYLGGRVARTNLYFPKLCPPSCGLEINFKRIKNNPDIMVWTMAELKSLSGSPGDCEATIRIAPRFVTDACTMCGACAEACPVEIPNDFNLGLSKTKAAYLPHSMAFPARYVIERSACPQGCKACKDACTYGAIDLDMAVEHRKIPTGAVIAATGWKPYDATRIENLGFGRYPNVVTNVIMERLAAPNGPTGGKILRPSDGKAPLRVAFVQCAGSRDENHLPYCSAVCCAASLKQATYIRSQCPEAGITIFYIDVRTPGRLEDFYAKVAADDKITLIKGKAAKVEEEPDSRDILVTAEDALSGKRTTKRVQLLVLATGIVPQSEGLPVGFELDEDRFVRGEAGRTGFYAAGCVRRPEEVSATVQDGTSVALKALQCLVKGARHE